MSSLDDVALEEVLRHLARVTPEGRRRAARDPVTRMYLQAGLRLLEEQVSAPHPDVLADEPGNGHPFLAWLSRARVAAETRNEPHASGLPRMGTEAGLRDRWEPHGDFIADLLLVALTGANWGRAVSVQDEYVAAMAGAGAGDFAAVVGEVCYQDLLSLHRSPGFRVQLLATAMTDRYPLLREALASTYDTATAQRAAYYAQIIDAQGVRLKPGFSPQALADMFTALAEGLTMRMIAGHTSRVLDHEARSSLLGLGVMTIFSSAIDTSPAE